MHRNARGVLQPIVAAKEAEIERLRSRTSELRSAAERMPPIRPFADALRGPRVQLIAEFKRRSPSAGWIREAAMIADVLPEYEAAGAAACSILTDREFFGGSLEDLERGRNLTKLPCLRKDFLLDEIQLCEARVAGADAVLLIVRLLDDAQLRDLLQSAHGLGLDVLTEIHERAELEPALQAGARVIGINNRNLSSFDTNLDTVLAVLPDIPADVTVVAESGIHSGADVARFGAAGIDAVLVGEALMRAPEPGKRVAELVGHARLPRKDAIARP
jgi:indole-3-glycerol phosphate synthase